MATYIEMANELSGVIEQFRQRFANTQMANTLSAIQLKITDEVRAFEAELQKNSDHVQMSLLDLAPVSAKVD
jgi:hypothetical protein